MGSLDSDQQRPGLRMGQENYELSQMDEEGIVKIVFDRSIDICSFLYEGLGEVYSEQDLEMIESIRCVLDLKATMKTVKTLGAVRAAQGTIRNFLEAAQNIDCDMLERCERPEWREQYQLFLKKIAEISKMKGSDDFSSMYMYMMVLLMNTEGKRYLGCEAVMSILVQASAMKSVESVVESWISVLEHHSSKTRKLKAETVESEMMVAINGPALQHCDAIIKESMVAYWSRKKFQQGHFTRRSDNVKSYLVSKSVDSLNSKPIKNMIMM